MFDSGSYVSRICVAFTTLLLLLYARLHRGLSHSGGVPRIGGPGVFNYLRTAFRYTFDAENVIHAGRGQFPGKPFVIPTLSGPVFFLPPKYLDLLRSSTDEVFNQPKALNEDLQLPYTMNIEQTRSPYQAMVCRTDVNRSIPILIPEVHEEIILALEKVLPISGDRESVSIPLYSTMTRMVARISNHVMLGAELGRNEDFVRTVVTYAETTTLIAALVHWSPFSLRPFTYRLMASILGGKKDVIKFIIPFLERYKKEREFMDEKPTLVAEFLLKASPPGETMEGIAIRLMNLNYASTHTSSIFLTQTLFELALLSEKDRECIRTEVRDAVEAEGGWNQSALSKFHMIDSALREVGRVHGLMHFALPRLAMRDHDLGDNTVLPAGYRVAIDIKAVHFNPEVYAEPNRCDLFRFAKLRESADLDTKYTFASTDSNYLPFGAGRHACAGRFFAAMELKLILAHILLNYNFSFPLGYPGRPSNILFNGAIVPNSKARMVFTKRL